MSRFDLDLSEVATERPLIPVGIYQARIVKGEIRQGVSDKGAWANISLTLGISSPEATQATNQDEPKVFFSGMFSFDDSGKFDVTGCPQIGQFLEATGFKNTPTEDFANDETEQAETERDYILALFKSMLDASVGTDLMCKVVQKKHYQEDRMVNDCTNLAKLEED